MGILLENGKYQVLENIVSEPGYSASVCIDVETKNNFSEYIFNIYSESSYINKFLPLYHALPHSVCGDFHKVLPGDRCVMAVFDYHKGAPLKKYLDSLAKDDYPARAEAAGSFLDASLVLATLPPVFAASVLQPPYTVYTAKDKSVRFNYIVRPQPETESQTESQTETPDEKIPAEFVSYLEKAFVKNRYLPETASGFVNKIRTGEITGFVNICSAWRRLSADAMNEYLAYRKETFFGYIKRLALTKSRKKREKLKNL